MKLKAEQLRGRRERLIQEVIWYTKQERADRDVADTEMVDSWLTICRLAGYIDRATKKAAREAGGT